jgi:hypothetical protein
MIFKACYTLQKKMSEKGKFKMVIKIHVSVSEKLRENITFR